MKFCPECRANTYNDLDSYDWIENKINESLKQYDLAVHDYKGSGIYVGCVPVDKGQKLIDKITETNKVCMKIFGKEADIHYGEMEN